MKRLLPILVLLAVIATSFTSARADDAALNLLAKDPHMIILVPNPQALSAKIDKFADALGLPQEMGRDAWTIMKMQAGGLNGIADDKPIILTMEVPLEKEKEPENLKAFIPVSDAKAFLANFGGDASKDLQTLNHPQGGELFAHKLANNYYLFTDSKEASDAHKPGNGAAKIKQFMGAQGSKYVDEADVSIMFDWQAILADSKMVWEDVEKEMKAEVEKVRRMEGDQAADALHAMSDSLSGFVRDMQGGVVTVDISDAGIGYTNAIQFKSGSDSHAWASKAGKQKSLFDRVPQKSFLFAFSADHSRIDVDGLIDFVSTAIAEEMPDMKKVLEPAMGVLKLAKSTAGAMYTPAPGAMMMPGGWETVYIYESDDPKQFLDQYGKSFAALNEVKLQTEVGELSYASQYTADAMQIDGVSIGQYSITANMPPDMMAQMGQQAAVMQMFSSQQGYAAAVDKHVIITQGANPKIMTESIKAVREGKGLAGDPTFKSISSTQMPEGTFMQGYVGVDGLVGMATPLLMQFGIQHEAPVEPLEPISLGVGATDGGVAYRVFLPTKSTKELVDIGQKAWMMFGGMFAPGPGEMEGWEEEPQDTNQNQGQPPRAPM